MICACGTAEIVQQGLCRHCWAEQLGRKRRIYVWTPALQAELRAAYALPRAGRTVAIGKLLSKAKFSRDAVKCEAQRLGIAAARQRWTKEEDGLLRELIGCASLRTISKRLGRRHGSVVARAKQLSISLRARDGYTIAEVQRITGSPYYRVKAWLDRGMFGFAARTNNGVRIADRALVRFLRHNYQEIDFQKADQTFLKGVLRGKG